MQNKPPHQRKPSSKLQDFFDSLKPAFLTPRWGTSYTPLDRYRDFNATFAGAATEEQAKKCLAQIIDMCEGKPITLNQISDHAYLAFRQGLREAGMNIVVIMNQEPNDSGQKDYEND